MRDPLPVVDRELIRYQHIDDTALIARLYMKMRFMSTRKWLSGPRLQTLYCSRKTLFPGRREPECNIVVRVMHNVVRVSYCVLHGPSPSHDNPKSEIRSAQSREPAPFFPFALSPFPPPSSEYLLPQLDRPWLDRSRRIHRDAHRRRLEHEIVVGIVRSEDRSG